MRYPSARIKTEHKKQIVQSHTYKKEDSQARTSVDLAQANYTLGLACLREVDDAICVSEAGVRDSHEIVAIEVPVDVSYNGYYCFSSSLNPREIEDYAYGISLTSGMIDHVQDIDSLTISFDQGRIDLDIHLDNKIDLFARINTYAPSFGFGCGLDSAEMKRRVCEGFQTQKSSVRREFEAVRLKPEAIWQVIRSLYPKQKMHQATGATHAAIFANMQGEILELREDVGRHNAVDKLIGALMRRGICGDEGFVYLSSRCAHELILKCARFKVGIVATVSAPTSAVLDYAKREGITLCAFARDRRFTIYTHPERIVLDRAES